MWPRAALGNPEIGGVSFPGRRCGSINGIEYKTVFDGRFAVLDKIQVVCDIVMFASLVVLPLLAMWQFRRAGGDSIPGPTWLIIFFLITCALAHAADAVDQLAPGAEFPIIVQVAAAVLAIAAVPVLSGYVVDFLGLKQQARRTTELQSEVQSRRRAEQASRDAAEFTRAVLDSLPEAIAVIDPDGDILTVNAEWRRQSQTHNADRATTPPTSSSGKNYLVASGVVFPTDPRSEEEVTVRLKRLLDDHTAFSAEYRTDVGESRSGHWILMRAMPLRTRRGGAVVSHHDITGRKQVEEALVEARSAADEASQAKSRFLANMSHEIRTPMTAVLGYADLLAGELTDQGHLDSVGLLRRHGQFLLEILDDILDISKIEAGKLDIAPIECELPPLIADLQSLMNVRAIEKGIALRLEYTTRIPATVRTDPIRLRQIIMNLVGNAIKFTEEGSVCLRVSYLQDGIVPEENRIPAPDQPHAAAGDADEPAAPAARGPGRLLFVIRDTGIGMSPPQVKNLFQPFMQADPSTTRKYGGTGLGLAISRSLTKMLGGDIWVRSELDKGSTFQFTVTCDVGSPVPTIDPSMISPSESGILISAPPEIPRLDGIYVLLVEDTPGLRFLVSRILQVAGAEVEAVENGLLAIEAVDRGDDASRPFDIILMDVQMPVMNGFDATRQLRNAGRTLPIIALTAGAMTGDREKCLAAGCDEYIPKPIDRGTLLRAIFSLVANHSQHVVTDSFP